MEDSQLKKASSIYQTGRNKIIQIWSMQKDIAHNLSEDRINQKCIFLVGDTKVGKTTLLYYLSGLKLKLIENQDKKTKEMQPEVIYENAIICNNLSTTQIPNIYSKNEGEFGVSLIDMPGMNDDRFVSLISNIFTFTQVFNQTQTIKQIHIAFIISQEMFDAQDIKENIREFIEHFNLEIFEKQKNISLIFTKTEDDIDTLKQQFFEYLESIKEDIEDQEDKEYKDIAKFIQILKKLDSQEELAYCFPQQQPNQQEGQKITAKIVQRNKFIENDRTSLLNQRMMENILLSSKLKSSAFQPNFIEILNQLQKTFELSLQMATELIKFMHDKFVGFLFQNQDTFQSSKNDFLAKYTNLILSFRTNVKIQDTLDGNPFGETISAISQKLKQQKTLYAVDKALAQTLKCVNSQETTSEDGIPNFNLLINLSQHLYEVFFAIKRALRNIERNELFKESIENMAYFYEWISSSWFTSLSKVHSLQKITDKLQQATKDLQRLKLDLWNQLNSNQPYFAVFKTFSEKPIEQHQSDSDQQSDQEPQIVKKVVGPTLNQLIEKYIKPKYQKIDSTITKIKGESKSERLQQQTKIQEQIRTIVQNIESTILTFNKQVKENSMKVLPTDEQISTIFFHKKHLRHKIHLESALNNLFQDLKFFIYILNMKKDHTKDCEKIKECFEFYIENLCESLEQYWLYEEAIVLYVFSDNFGKAVQTLADGFEHRKVSEGFVRGLIQKLDDLREQNNGNNWLTKEKSEQISQIVMRCYNFLIAQCSDTRKQQQQHQKQLAQFIGKIKASPKSQRPSQPTNKLNLNHTILQATAFSAKGIIKKIQDIQRRNSQSKIYAIYREIFPSKQKADRIRRTPGIDETMMAFRNVTPQPSQ